MLREPARMDIALISRFELGEHSRFIVEESFAVGAATTATIFVVRRDFFVIERWHGGIK